MYTRAYVEITNICNMNCSFCHGHSRESRAMTEAEFSHILQQLQGKTQYIYYHLMGEPLTHRLLPRFLQMAKEAGFRSVITTNGTLLHKTGEELLRAGVHKVNISLHSQETEENLPGYLQRAAAFADLAGKYGTLVSFRLWNKGCDDGKNAIVEAALRELLPGEWTENSRGYRIRDKLYIEWGERFAWPDAAAEKVGERVFCYGMQDHFGILCDGTVVPCCLDSDGVIALGNVFRQDLQQILDSDRAQAMVKGFQCRTPSEDLCRRCGYAQRFNKFD